MNEWHDHHDLWEDWLRMRRQNPPTDEEQAEYDHVQNMKAINVQVGRYSFIWWLNFRRYVTLANATSELKRSITKT